MEVRQARKAAAERTPMTRPQQKKTRTMEPEASEKGRALTFAGRTFVSASTAESQGHGTSDAFATGLRAHSSLGRFLKCCLLSLCAGAWFCSRAQPGETLAGLL